jgi:hypothetical protein
LLDCLQTKRTALLSALETAQHLSHIGMVLECWMTQRGQHHEPRRHLLLDCLQTKRTALISALETAHCTAPLTHWDGATVLNDSTTNRVNLSWWTASKPKGPAFSLLWKLHSTLPLIKWF